MIDAYVTGGGLPALAAALDLAELGLRVRVHAGDPATRVPEAPERDAEGALRALMGHVAEPIADGDSRDDAVAPREAEPEATWLRSGEGWSPQPLPSVCGVPGVPLSRDAIAVLGGGAAFRAYLDRVKPLLTIGKTRRLGELVQKRLGPVVRERLVEPVVVERFGVSSFEVDAAVAAAGLNEAMSRAGALTGGVLAEADRDVARETLVEPAAGWPALDDALLRRLRAYAAETPEHPPVRVERAGAGWRVTERDGTIVEARSVVLDVGRNLDVDRGLDAPVPELVGARATSVEPLIGRTVARIRVEQPEGCLNAAASLLQCVEDRDGARWSLRLSRAGDVWRAVLAGPASEVQPGDVAAGPDELSRLIENAGFRQVRGAEWSRMRVAAPAPTIEARAAAEEGATPEDPADEADSLLLVVGSRVHGDSLSAATAAARESVIPLRRRLTGIAE